MHEELTGKLDVINKEGQWSAFLAWGTCELTQRSTVLGEFFGGQLVPLLYLINVRGTSQDLAFYLYDEHSLSAVTTGGTNPSTLKGSSLSLLGYEVAEEGASGTLPCFDPDTLFNAFKANLKEKPAHELLVLFVQSIALNMETFFGTSTLVQNIVRMIHREVLQRMGAEEETVRLLRNREIARIKRVAKKRLDEFDADLKRVTESIPTEDEDSEMLTALRGKIKGAADSLNLDTDSSWAPDTSVEEEGE